MAGVGVYVNTGLVALVAATPKSLLQIKAPANQRLIIKTLRMLGDQSAGGTDAPVKVRMTQSSASFGTFSAATAGKQDSTNPETLQGTYGTNATVEPTTPTDSGLEWYVQPQGGIIEMLGSDQWIPVPGGHSVQFECTSPGTPSLAFCATVEE